SAATSACGPPARSCQPSPMILPSFATTQPTRGFGCVVAAPRAASSSARAMAWRSKSEKVVIAGKLTWVAGQCGGETPAAEGRGCRYSARQGPAQRSLFGRRFRVGGQQRQLLAI